MFIVVSWFSWTFVVLSRVVAILIVSVVRRLLMIVAAILWVGLVVAIWLIRSVAPLGVIGTSALCVSYFGAITAPCELSIIVTASCSPIVISSCSLHVISPSFVSTHQPYFIFISSSPHTLPTYPCMCWSEEFSL